MKRKEMRKKGLFLRTKEKSEKKIKKKRKKKRDKGENNEEK
jgi:hypothetical protein